VHYNYDLVMTLVQQTIAEKRTSEPFVLLEGLFNMNKLEREAQQLQMRTMDELF